MSVYLTGLFLSLTVTLHLVLSILIYRQRIYSFLVPLFIYLNVLLALVETATLFLFQPSATTSAVAFMKIRLVLETFIPPVLVLLVQEYSLGSLFPRVTFKHASLFVASLALALLAIQGEIFHTTYSMNGIVYPEYTRLFWIFLVYFYSVLIYVGFTFYRNYRKSRRSYEIQSLRVIVRYLFPIAVVVISVLHLLPLMHLLHPFVFLAYPVIGGIMLYVSFRFQFFEYDETSRRFIHFFIVSAFLVTFFSLVYRIGYPTMFLGAIGIFLFSYMMSDRVVDWLRSFFFREGESEEMSVEEELTNFLGEVGRLLDEKELAQFLGNFSSKVLKCTKVAVVFSRFDIRPYELMYNVGFEGGALEELMASSRSRIMEILEYDHKIINKFDYPPGDPLFQEMEKYRLYMVLPLVAQNNLTGFIFLGGDRKQVRFFSHDLRFARLFSVQAANAIQNVRAIQKAMQSEKMAELGTMASQLAHDFQSFITLVKLDVPQEGRLRNHAVYMEKLVQDLLHYTRPQELRYSAVNINQLIDMTLDMLDIPPNISVERHYSSDLPLINVDTNQMRRVFLNLLENSIRAMRKKGGRLKITTRPLRPLSHYRRNPWIYIEILDEGEGIPEEFLEKIFEPFFTTHKHEGGNGMGLAMVKQIITRHRGFIDVASRVGKGTIFNIRLPYIS